MKVKTVSYGTPGPKVRNLHGKIIRLAFALTLTPIVILSLNHASSSYFPSWSPYPANRSSDLARQLFLPPRPWAEGTPRWCAQLVANPRERRRESSIYDCGRDRFGARCRDGKPRFFSQYNQDMYTWQKHWRFLRRSGVYLDIAANEPVRISNTYFYDRCLGWAGLCVEANEQYRSLLAHTRSCGIMPTCVSNVQENVTFVMDGGLGGVASTNKNNRTRVRPPKQHLTCVRTANAIDAAGIYRIDMLSLDVEGHELKVLQGINWKTTKINVIVMENEAGAAQAAVFLKKLGYRILKIPMDRVQKAKAGSLLRDIILVHKDVVWGKPV